MEEIKPQVTDPGDGPIKGKPTKREQLYAYMKSTGAKMPETQEDFNGYLENTEYKSKIWRYLKKDPKSNPGSWEDFDQKISQKYDDIMSGRKAPTYGLEEGEKLKEYTIEEGAPSGQPQLSPDLNEAGSLTEDAMATAKDQQQRRLRMAESQQLDRSNAIHQYQKEQGWLGKKDNTPERTELTKQGKASLIQSMGEEMAKIQDPKLKEAYAKKIEKIANKGLPGLEKDERSFLEKRGLADSDDKSPLETSGKSMYNILAYQTPSALLTTYAGLKKYADDIRVGRGLTSGKMSVEEAKEIKKEGNAVRAAVLEHSDLFNKRGTQYAQDIVKEWGGVNSIMDGLNYVAWAGSQGAAQIPAAVATFGASALVLEMGEVYLGSVKKIAEDKGMTIEEVINQGLDEPGTALAWATAAAALERLGAGSVMKSFTKKALQKELQQRTFYRLAKAPLVVEPITEAAQTVIEHVGTTHASGGTVEEGLKTVPWEEVAEAARQGAIGGQGVTSVGSMVSSALPERQIDATAANEQLLGNAEKTPEGAVSEKPAESPPARQKETKSDEKAPTKQPATRKQPDKKKGKPAGVAGKKETGTKGKSNAPKGGTRNTGGKGVWKREGQGDNYQAVLSEPQGEGKVGKLRGVIWKENGKYKVNTTAGFEGEYNSIQAAKAAVNKQVAKEDSETQKPAVQKPVTDKKKGKTDPSKPLVEPPPSHKTESGHVMAKMGDGYVVYDPDGKTIKKGLSLEDATKLLGEVSKKAPATPAEKKFKLPTIPKTEKNKWFRPGKNTGVMYQDKESGAVYSVDKQNNKFVAQSETQEIGRYDTQKEAKLAVAERIKEVNKARKAAEKPKTNETKKPAKSSQKKAVKQDKPAESKPAPAVTKKPKPQTKKQQLIDQTKKGVVELEGPGKGGGTQTIVSDRSSKQITVIGVDKNGKKRPRTTTYKTYEDFDRAFDRHARNAKLNPTRKTKRDVEKVQEENQRKDAPAATKDETKAVKEKVETKHPGVSDIVKKNKLKPIIKEYNEAREQGATAPEGSPERKRYAVALKAFNEALIGLKEPSQKRAAEMIVKAESPKRYSEELKLYLGDVKKTETKKKKTKKEENKDIIDEFEDKLEQGAPTSDDVLGLQNNGIFPVSITKAEMDGLTNKATELWNRAKRKWFPNIASMFKSRGLLPKGAFAADRKSKAWMYATEQQMKTNVNKLLNAVRKEAKIGITQNTKKSIPAKVQDLINEIMQPSDPAVNYASKLSQMGYPKTAEAAQRLRNHVDYMSNEMMSRGMASEQMEIVITENMGTYLTRSYNMFQDPQKWMDHIQDNPEGQALRNRAVAWMRSVYAPNKASKMRKKAVDLRTEADGLIVDAEVAELKGGKDAGKALRTEAKVKRAKATRTEKKAEVWDNMTPEEADAKIWGYLFERGRVFSGTGQGKTLTRRDLKILRRRKDVPKMIRELLGEETDPLANYVNSVQKMAAAVSRDKFIIDLVADGDGKYLFKEPTGKFSEPVYKSGGKETSPLNEYYTSPELIDALQSFESDDMVKMEGWASRNFWRFNSRMKEAKTVLSFQTQIRNLLSNIFIAATAGDVNPMKGYKAIVGTWNHMQSSGKMEGYLKELQELGVLDSSVTVGEIQEFGRIASQKTQADILPGDGFVGVVQGVRGAANKLYQAGDNIFKLYGWENQMQKYSWAFKGDPTMMKDGKPTRKLKEFVAERVTNTYPTYSKVWRGIKKLRRFPLMGTFVSFSGEMLRTQGHNLAYGISDIKEGIKTNNKKLAQVGALRTTGTLATYAALTTASTASAAALGIGDDEDENLDRLLPPWEQLHDRIYLSKENGVVRYIDLGYTSPLTHIKSMLKSIWTDNPDHEGIMEFATDLGRALEPFLGADILAERILDISRNRTAQGNNVYSEHDDPGGVASSVWEHMWEVLEPGTITSARKIYKGFKQKGYSDEELERIKKFDAGQEIGAFAMGQRIQTVDLRDPWRFYMSTFMNDMPNTQKLMSRKYYKKGIPDEENRQKLAKKADRARVRLLDQAKVRFETALEWGVPPLDLEDEMRRKQVPKDYQHYIMGIFEAEDLISYGEQY